MSGLTKFKLVRQPPASPASPASPAMPAPARAPSVVSDQLPQAKCADPIAVAMDKAAAEVPRFLTPKMVAAMLGLTERTLERWRITGEGPRYVKLSRSTVRYLPDDVSDFVQGGLRANTAQ